MFRELKHILAVGGLLLGGAAHASSGTSTSRGRINQPISFNNVTDLNFGTIVRGAAAGTVTINARTGARTSTGGVAVVGATGFTTANFNGSGSSGRVVTITLGAAAITLTNGTGGAMTVNTFRASANGSVVQTLPRNYTLPASGALALRIGGRLNVAANQADGGYAGTITVNMNYQ